MISRFLKSSSSQTVCLRPIRYRRKAENASFGPRALKTGAGARLRLVPSLNLERRNVQTSSGILLIYIYFFFRAIYFRYLKPERTFTGTSVWSRGSDLFCFCFCFHPSTSSSTRSPAARRWRFHVRSYVRAAIDEGRHLHFPCIDISSFPFLLVYLLFFTLPPPAPPHPFPRSLSVLRGGFGAISRPHSS